MGTGIAAAARRPCRAWGFAAQSCRLSCSEGFSLTPAKVLGGTWVPHARGLALPAQIPVPSCADGSLRRCFPTRVLPAHPASWARSPGTSSQPLGALGESGCCSHAPRRLRRGGDSPAPVAESGRQLPAGGGRSPPGTFETQIGHGRYLKMPASSCQWPGWAGGGCWGPRGV